jgi:hypothetical protein
MLDTRKLLLLGMLVFVLGICVGIKFEHDFLSDECDQQGKFVNHQKTYQCGVQP